MEIVQPQKIERGKEKVQTSVPKESLNTYPFQWLLYKPQLHAVEPFDVRQASRNENTQRVGDSNNMLSAQRGS
jgi:hypothetical protein